MTFSVWILGFLLVSLSQALTHFPEKFVVAKSDESVTLTCDAAVDGPVTWKLNEMELEKGGKNLTVTEVGGPNLGEYSCWSQQQKLGSVYLLEEEEEEEEEDGEEADSPIKCWAKSYHCNFSCVWNSSSSSSSSSSNQAVRVGLGHHCSEGSKSCQWISSGSSSSSSSGGGFLFNLTHDLSPYTEEGTLIELTVEAIEDLSFSRTIKTFYLREIVQPDSPHIGPCQEQGNDLNVTIDPPSSWSTPHSYFSLEHEIEYESRHDGSFSRSFSTLLPKSISRLRARSRDAVVQSTWSEWTPWKNVRTGKKGLCKCKNTEKYCCPQLLPGDLDDCKKKRKKKKQKKLKAAEKHGHGKYVSNVNA